MKCVVAIVFKKMISFSIKHEACIGNSVGYSSNKCSKVACTILTAKQVRTLSKKKQVRSFIYLSIENKTEYTIAHCRTVEEFNLNCCPIGKRLAKLLFLEKKKIAFNLFSYWLWLDLISLVTMLSFF